MHIVGICKGRPLNECPKHIVYNNIGFGMCFIEGESCIKTRAYNFTDCKNVVDIVISLAGEDYIIEEGFCEKNENCYTFNDRCVYSCESVKGNDTIFFLFLDTRNGFEFFDSLNIIKNKTYFLIGLYLLICSLTPLGMLI